MFRNIITLICHLKTKENRLYLFIFNVCSPVSCFVPCLNSQVKYEVIFTHIES